MNDQIGNLLGDTARRQKHGKTVESRCGEVAESSTVSVRCRKLQTGRTHAIGFDSQNHACFASHKQSLRL